MSYTTMNVRVETTDKLAFEEFCHQTGLNISSAVNLFVKTVIRMGKIPFEIAADPFYSHENQKCLIRSIEQLNNGKGVEHDLLEVDE